MSSLPSRNNDLDNFIIDLIDITIAVDHGESPFAYRKRSGVLSEGNDSMLKSVAVAMNPAAPYLYLPNSSCAAITKDLPVSYNPKYGLCFWNVDDPRYTQIVTSPSYLGFTFRAPSLSAGNLTIKVPFQLLNLTLESPLIATRTQYFHVSVPKYHLLTPWDVLSCKQLLLELIGIRV